MAGGRGSASRGRGSTSEGGLHLGGLPTGGVNNGGGQNFVTTLIFPHASCQSSAPSFLICLTIT